jgi:hypothetical protein
MSQHVRVVLLAVALCALQVSMVYANPGTSDAVEPNDPIERARLHFRLGVDFYREKNYRAALIEFQRAYSASPHYKLLYNLGQAALELQEDNNAIGYLTRYLAEGTTEISDERRVEVEQNIVKLRARLAIVTVKTNQPGAEIYLDETRLGVAPLREAVKVSVGRRRFVATKHGYPDAERVIDVAAGDRVTVELEFKAQPQLFVSKVQLPAQAPPDDGAASPALWTGMATGALAVGAGITSILTMVAQNRYDDEKKDFTSRDQLERLRTDAKTKALVADVLWGTTIAGVGVTAVLLLTTGGSEREPAAGVSVRVHPTGVKVSGVF